ncbi:hypothetical protein ACHAWF_002451 [Thalassiosira exigua]
MSATSKKSNAPKKRSLSSSSSGDDQPAKKKSPLFNLPQNYYAPAAIASMTKEELFEWRKEQRRKRNRESAAASRNKTRARIEELEGEVEQWRSKYAEMEHRMRCMERHIEFLTKLNAQPEAQVCLAPSSSPPPVVIHPNSPPRSPSPRSSLAVPVPVPSSVPPPPDYSSRANTAHLFPALLSEPKESVQVEKQEVAAASVLVSEEEPAKRLTPISRQA